MTATLPPAAPPAAGPPPDRPEPRAPRRRRGTEAPSGLLVATELSLTALTCAAVVGFGRLFADWSFLAPLLVVALVTHVTVAWCRRRGLGVPLAAALTLVEWVLVVTWLFFVDTTFALLPTTDTLSTARSEIDRSWSAFQTIVAPAPVQTGFLLAAAAAVAGGAFLADWAAFRLWSTREALVPPITLFVFATLLADDRYRAACAVLLVGAALVFVLLHRVVDLERSESWVTARRGRAARTLLAGGAGLAVVALVAGVVAAPHLPGVDEDPLVDWRNHGGNDTRVLNSPLVDLRARLVDTSDVPLFQVRANRPAYWRVAALDRFDGTVWKLEATTDQVADGTLALDVGDPRGERISQTVTMQNLRTTFLPAASVATELRVPPSDVAVRYDTETATMIADDPTAEGTTYSVESVAPDYTAEELRAADPDPSAAPSGTLSLPDDFSGLASDLARQATAGAGTPFDQALALQQWFRQDGGFTYSTQVASGQSTGAIDRFLTDRVGYCEQFAGAFAAMARSLGIPARVAVGYTWGEQDPVDPQLFSVLGRNAHAWPEVWLGDVGWVAFEPTPGRGNPAAVSYTGVAQSQQTEAPVNEDTTTTTTAPEQSATPTTVPGADEVAAPGSTVGRSDDPWGTAARGLVLAVAAGALYLLVVPGALALRRRRRRARATTPTARIGAAWADTTEALGAVGLRPRADETHAEVARRGGEAVPEAREALGVLAATADDAVYGTGATEVDGDEARRAADEVDAAVDASLGRVGRLVRRLDPRPLWQGHTRRHRAD